MTFRASSLSPLVALLLAACGAEGTGTKVRAGVILEIDGVTIHESELEPLLAYATAMDPSTGRNTRIAGILELELLPRALARRAFADQRAAQLELAQGLRRAVGNGGFPELRAKARQMSQERTFLRHELPLPIAAWCFDPAKVGQVSAPIETPQGFSIVSTYAIAAGMSTLGDVAEVCQAAFYTHDAAEFADWWEATRRQVTGRVSYVHPDYRRALPPWLEAPRSR